MQKREFSEIRPWYPSCIHVLHVDLGGWFQGRYLCSRRWYQSWIPSDRLSAPKRKSIPFILLISDQPTVGQLMTEQRTRKGKDKIPVSISVSSQSQALQHTTKKRRVQKEEMHDGKAWGKRFISNMLFSLSVSLLYSCLFSCLAFIPNARRMCHEPKVAISFMPSFSISDY